MNQFNKSIFCFYCTPIPLSIGFLAGQSRVDSFRSLFTHASAEQNLKFLFNLANKHLISIQMNHSNSAKKHLSYPEKLITIYLKAYLYKISIKPYVKKGISIRQNIIKIKQLIFL